MFSSFMRRFTYSQVASPCSAEQQSGPAHTNRWRFSLPIPNAVADASGEIRSFAIVKFELRSQMLEAPESLTQDPRRGPASRVRYFLTSHFSLLTSNLHTITP